ncbi:MAG: hypothetical protein JWR68_1926 [Polaromonas sp.]|nr:hypothetical protein [Polaromonas sp.]
MTHTAGNPITWGIRLHHYLEYLAYDYSRMANTRGEMGILVRRPTLAGTTKRWQP